MRPNTPAALRRSRILGLVAGLAVITACGSNTTDVVAGGGTSSIAASAAPSGLAVSRPISAAYVARDEAHFVDSTGVDRLRLAAPDRWLDGNPQFTLDGRFIVLRSRQDGPVTVVDAATADTRDIDASGPVVPVGGSVIGWIGDGAVWTLDLGDPVAPPLARGHVDLPDRPLIGAARQATPWLVGISDEFAIVARSECPCGSGGENVGMYSVTADGVTTQLAVAAGDYGTIHPSDDGARAAVAFNGKGGAVCSETRIIDIDLAAGTAVADKPVNEGCSYATALDWNADGDLETWLSIWDSSASDAQVGAQHWVDAGQWAPVGEASAVVYSDHAADGTSVSVWANDLRPRYDGRNRLVIGTGASAVQVDSDVRAVAVAP